MSGADSSMRPGRDATESPVLSWKAALGKLEIATIGLFVFWRAMVWLAPAAAVLPFLIFLVPAVWVVLRWSRRLVRMAVWRGRAALRQMRANDTSPRALSRGRRGT